MAGEKVGPSQSRKRKEATLSELKDSITRTKSAKKKKNVDPETSFERDQKSASPTKRDDKVVLALCCPELTEKKVARRKALPSTSGNHHLEHKMAGVALSGVQKEEVPVSKALDESKTLDDPDQVSKVQPMKKRKKHEKNMEVQQKDETLSSVSATPLASLQSLKTYKRKVKTRPLDNILDDKRDKCSGEASFNCSNVSKKKRSKRGEKTDNSPNTISRHNFSDDCLPQWNRGDSSNAQKSVHEKPTGDSRTVSYALKPKSGQVSPSELYKEGHITSTLTEQICSMNESSAIHSNGLKNKKRSKRKSIMEDVSDLANVQELSKEGHNTLSRNCAGASVHESPVNLREKRSKKKLKRDKKKHTSDDGKGSEGLSILGPSAEQPDCSSVEGTEKISSNEYCKEEVVPSVGDMINDAGKVVTETNENTPYPHASKAKSRNGTSSKLCEVNNTSSRNCASVPVDESLVNLPKKRSATKKIVRKDKKKHTSNDGKGSDDLSILDPSAEQPDCSSVKGTGTKSVNEDHKKEVVPSIGDIINDAGKVVAEIKEKSPDPHASNVNSTQETASDLYEAGQNTLSRNCTTFSVDKSTVNPPDKKSESGKRLGKKKRKQTSHDAKDSDDLSNFNRSAEKPNISSIDGTVTKSISDNDKEGVVSSIEDVTDGTVMPAAEIKENPPHRHTSKVKSTQETASGLYEAGQNTLSRNITIFSVDESPVNLPDKKSESRKGLRKGKRKLTSHDAKDSDVLSNLDLSTEHPEISCIEGTVTKILNGFHKGEVVPSIGDEKDDATMPGTKIKESTPYPHTSEEKSGQDIVSELHEEGLNALSKNCTVFSEDNSPTNLPDNKSESRKGRRKDERGHTSHEAIDSDDLSNLDRSAEQPSVEGAVKISLNEYDKGEVVPKFGDVKNDAVMLGTEIKENTLVERSASLERAVLGHTPKKLLVLDLNGLLVDIVSFLPAGYKADKRIGGKALLKRPFCDDFIKFCFERFNVGVWSSRTKKNVDNVVDFIMGDVKHKLLFCWHQSQCTKTGYNTVEDEHKPMVFKELRKLWEKYDPKLPWNRGEYNESNTLLLDDSPYKALLNPRHTAIFPYSYEFRNANDNSLGPCGNLRMYLENIAAAEHVQKYVEQNPFGQRGVTNKNPSWGYYLNVIKANRLRLPP